MIKTALYFLLFYFLFIIPTFEKETYVELDEDEKYKQYSIRILEKTSIKCGLQMNDEAEVDMRTFAPGVSIMPQILSDYQFGYATQTFIVGKHNVSPLNKGLLGMCVGELRRIGLAVGDIGKIYYEIRLKNYKKNNKKSDEL